MLLFLILLWLITAVSVFLYLVSWPTVKPWTLRLAFDVPALLILLFICIAVRPGTPSNPMEAAEATQWRPLLSSIYVAAISILFLSATGIVRYFIFRAPSSSDAHI